jgi:precorrin-6B methylase 2
MRTPVAPAWIRSQPFWAALLATFLFSSTAAEISSSESPKVSLPNASSASPTNPPQPLYQQRPGSPDGIGKWYLGREIAHYMTHHGAMWLERPERVMEEQPDRLIQALQLKPGQVVADIGAGSGYFTWRMAQRVLPGGKVYANDIQPEMLALLEKSMAARNITNVLPVLGSDKSPNLPEESIDLAIMVDVYHEMDQPYEMIQAIVKSLKPNGRLVFVEYRGEERWIPIKPLHKMTEAQVRKEMGYQELRWLQTLNFLPRQHVIIFQKHATPDTQDTKKEDL